MVLLWIYRSPFEASFHRTKSNHMRNVIFAINITLDGCADHIN